MRADADLMVYVAARWPSLVREAVLLGVHPDEAADAVADALARCRRGWGRASREENVDALVREELVRAAGRRSRTVEATREEAARQVLVLAPPGLEDLRARERENNRATLRRAAVVVVPLMLVAAGGGTCLAADDENGRGGSADSTISSVTVTREANPAPGVFWYAGGRLHLDHVVLAVGGLRQMTRIGDSVVYGDDAGRVVYVRDDGSRMVLGHKDPGAPVAATDENGWAAWIDTDAEQPTVVVKQAETGNEINRFTVDASARLVALDGFSVFYVDADGAHQRSAQASNTVDVSPPELLDVRSRIEAFQLDAGTVEVVQSIFNQSFDVPGEGAVLSPDGSIVASRIPGGDQRLVVYDTRSGSELPSGVTTADRVLAVAPGNRLTIAYVVDPGGPDGELQLRTCDLMSTVCTIAARIPDERPAPVLAR
jgi:hypothetical protein